MSLSADFPTTRPSLLLDFVNTQALDPRITFTRASSATYFDAAGVLQTAPAGQARFDYNPSTFAPLGLLIEEQRTNLLTYSDDFTNVNWSRASITSITGDTSVAPNKSTTADTIVFTGGGTASGIFQNGSVTSGVAYTQSLFCKYIDQQWVQLTFGSTPFGSAQYANFDIQNGSLGNVVGGTASIVSINNGWYRIAFTATATSTASGSISNPVAVNNGTATRIQALTASGTSLLVWGAQAEAGAFATSYIPTVASSVTRNADAASMTGVNFSSWYNAAEGTFYAEAAFVGLATARQVVNVSDNSANNLISIQTNPSTATTSRMNVISGGTTQSTLGFVSAFSAGVFSKNAATYKTNDFAFSSNGAAATTDTSGTVPSVTQLQIGALLTTNSNIHIRKISYYPFRLTNAQLQALTS